MLVTLFLSGRGGPLEIAVNAKVRNPESASLLAFYRPAGHSFADWIVVPSGWVRK
jgi:hypothetical protein